MGTETGLNMWDAVEKLGGRSGLVRRATPGSPARVVSAGCVRIGVWFSQDYVECKDWLYFVDDGDGWLPKIKPEIKPCSDPEYVIGWMLRTKRTAKDMDGDSIFWSIVDKRFKYRPGGQGTNVEALDTELISYPCVPADGLDW